MRIGIVSGYMPPHLGGIERIGQNLFTGYAAAGIEVRWVASRAPSNAPTREGQQIRVPCVNLVEDLLGVPVPLWGFRGWAEVNRLVQWADAVHVLECLYVCSAMAVILARWHGKPAVVSQNIGFVQYRSPLLNWLEHVAYLTLGRPVLRGASHVVLATPTAAAHVRRLFRGRGPQSSEFPVGIDTSRFRPATRTERRAARARLELPQERPIVLFAARLVEKKGVPVVVEVSRRLPRAGFFVLGDGPLRSLILEAGGNVYWRRTVSPDTMTDYYHAADCLVLPSHGEGLPLVVQEAMACGLPVVIADDEPYAQQLIEANVCRPAPRSADLLAKRVLEVIESPPASLGTRARAYAEQHWSLGTMVARHLSLFSELLARPIAPRELARRS